MKRFLRVGLRALPFSEILLLLGARLPPAVKGHWSQRLFGAMARARGGRRSCIDTNLGVTGARCIRLPLTAPDVYLFGTPNEYLGERGALGLATTLAPQGGGFVDVGAHYGYFSFAVAARGPARLPIHYFEPNPELFAIIEDNVQRNGLEQIIGHRSAVSDSNGNAQFHVDTNDSSASSLEAYTIDRQSSRVINVECVRFDGFSERHRLQDLVVKVDVENSEFRFLDGVGTSGGRIRHLIIEVLGPATGRRFTSVAAATLGMEAYYINDYRLEHAPEGAFRYVPPQYNWLFTRHDPRGLADLLRGTQFIVADVQGRVVS